MKLVASESLSRLVALHCSACGTAHSAFDLQRVSTCCSLPLVADYDLREPLSRDVIDQADSSMWRYGALLPLLHDEYIPFPGSGQQKRFQERFATAYAQLPAPA